MVMNVAEENPATMEIEGLPVAVLLFILFIGGGGGVECGQLSQQRLNYNTIIWRQIMGLLLCSSKLNLPTRFNKNDGNHRRHHFDNV